MSEVEDHDADDRKAEDRPYESERTTAPQSPYTGRDVAVGIVIALVGGAITFGFPLALLL